ncbi:MAG: sigma-70 family RNA polymerase sigma factor [Cyclobacteriaceae bacterium]|nr:sigma-70 family RNA polymerase sigma factor [Cyclobacteriaceae bacterium]
MTRLKKPTEQELIEGCLREDPKVQREVYELYSSQMFALCKRYVKDDIAAEDLLVIGFTKVFQKIGQYKATGAFGAWIRRIMVNECLMYLEKEKKLYMEPCMEGIVPPALQVKPSDELYVEDLLKMVESLPSGYRTVFNLFAIDGYSHLEIAKKLNISENTSKSQLNRARNHLQKMIALQYMPAEKAVSIAC